MSNPLRQRYRALTLPAPQPFVMLSEWIFLNLFNAKRAPRRSQAELNASAEQQRWTWQAIARGEGDPTDFPPKIAEKYAHRDREMAKQREASQRAIAANKAMMEMRKKSGPGSRAIDAENALERLRRQRSESAIRARQALDDLQQRVRTAELSQDRAVAAGNAIDELRRRVAEPEAIETADSSRAASLLLCAGAAETAGSSRAAPLPLCAGAPPGAEFGEPEAVDSIEDLIELRTVVAPAGPTGITFRTIESTGFSVVDSVAPNALLGGAVMPGDVLVRIDDDVPTRTLGSAAKVAALLRAREHAPIRSLHFAADTDDAIRIVIAAREEEQARAAAEARRGEYEEAVSTGQCGEDAVSAGKLLEQLMARAEAEEAEKAEAAKRASITGRLSAFFGTHHEPEEEEEEVKYDFDLPDPKNREEFNEFCEPIIAKECIAVMARMQELDTAVQYMQEKVSELERHGASEAQRAEARHRLELVREYVVTFERKFGLGDHAHRSHHLHLKFSGLPWWKRCCVRIANSCGFCLSQLTDEERLERIIRAKVRRDVAQACKWDEELRELEGDDQERRLIELARFELLTPSEQKIYMDNGGLATEEEPPAPVSTCMKVIASIVMFFLVITPTFLLLLFGVQKGKSVIKTWWIGTMTCFALEAGIFQPLILMCLHVWFPLLIRKKLKRLVDPTQLARFPFKTPLFEYPTTYLAHKYNGLVVAGRMLKRRSAVEVKSVLDSRGHFEQHLGTTGATTPVASAQPRASRPARLFITLLFFVIVMSPELQEFVILEILAMVTVGAIIIIKLVNRMYVWEQVLVGIFTGIAFLMAVRFCIHHRGHPKEIEDDSDDEDEDATEKKDAKTFDEETKEAPQEAPPCVEVDAIPVSTRVVLF